MILLGSTSRRTSVPCLKASGAVMYCAIELGLWWRATTVIRSDVVLVPTRVVARVESTGVLQRMELPFRGVYTCDVYVYYNTGGIIPRRKCKEDPASHGPGLKKMYVPEVVYN